MTPASWLIASVLPSHLWPARYHWRPGGGLPPSATHSTDTSEPEVASRGPVNGEGSPGSFKWTELGGAENIIHELLSDFAENLPIFNDSSSAGGVRK